MNLNLCHLCKHRNCFQFQKSVCSRRSAHCQTVSPQSTLYCFTLRISKICVFVDRSRICLQHTLYVAYVAHQAKKRAHCMIITIRIPDVRTAIVLSFYYQIRTYTSFGDEKTIFENDSIRKKYSSWLYISRCGILLFGFA